MFFHWTERKDVESSFIENIYYGRLADGTTGILVRFNGGRLQFYDAPLSTWDAFRDAGSAGSAGAFYNAHLRNSASSSSVMVTGYQPLSEAEEQENPKELEKFTVVMRPKTEQRSVEVSGRNILDALTRAEKLFGEEYVLVSVVQDA